MEPLGIPHFVPSQIEKHKGGEGESDDRLEDWVNTFENTLEKSVIYLISGSLFASVSFLSIVFNNDYNEFGQGFLRMFGSCRRCWRGVGVTATRQPL